MYTYLFNVHFLFQPPSLAILAFTESSLMRFQNDKPIGVTLAAKPAYPAITAQNRWVVNFMERYQVCFPPLDSLLCFSPRHLLVFASLSLDIHFSFFYFTLTVFRYIFLPCSSLFSFDCFDFTIVLYHC